MTFTITEEEKQILLDTAREAIDAKLMKRKPSYNTPTETLKTVCGAFVTLHKRGSLRGCIGNIIGTKPLAETVKEMAISSAFHDPRFPPLSKEEFKDIDIEISVLSPLKKIDSIEEIKIGEHGIYIQRGAASGVLLPQVATEQGWDRDTFLTHTCYKAGLPASCWEDPQTEISIFSAIVFGEHD